MVLGNQNSVPSNQSSAPSNQSSAPSNHDASNNVDAGEDLVLLPSCSSD